MGGLFKLSQLPQYKLGNNTYPRRCSFDLLSFWCLSPLLQSEYTAQVWYSSFFPGLAVTPYLAPCLLLSSLLPFLAPEARGTF